jgi:dTDP-D-glucose 4,6-dehydratase
LAQLVAKIMGKDLNYEMVESESARPGYDRRYALDGSKLAADGWVAPMTFEESIEKIVNWTLKNPHWVV